MYVTLHSTPNCYPLPSTTPVMKFSVAAHLLLLDMPYKKPDIHQPVYTGCCLSSSRCFCSLFLLTTRIETNYHS